MLRHFVCFLILAGAAGCSAFAASEQWIEVRSSHFTVLTDSNEKQARHILDQFERMRWMFQTLFPKTNVDPAAPIVVLAAKNGKSFQGLEPAAYLGKGQLNLAGYFLRTQDKNYVLLRLDAEQEHPFATVYHEYTHLQFSGMSEWIPLWLNEGLAEFFQNTEIHNNDVQLGEPSRDDILFLRQNRLIPLPVLFKIDATSPYYHEEEKGSIFYAESWALTHYLQVTDREKGTHKLNEYMTLLSHREDSLIAGEKVFGGLKQLQSSLESYIQASSYKQFILSSAAAPIDESSYKVRALTQTESDVARADVLANVGRVAEAHALLDSVLKADPKSADARETMGFLEFREGNRDAARKWYGEAVKLDSQSYLAHYYFAAMSMGESGPEEDAAIDASFRAAIRLNPAFAPAYDQLASFYGRRHEKLDEAHALSFRAIQLDPGNYGYRMNAANVLIVMDRFVDAEEVLRSAVKVAKNPGQVEAARSRIAHLEQIQKTRAQAKAAADTQTNEQGVPQSIVIENAPKHPTEAPDGPKHAAEGVIRGVTCTYPSVIDFRLEGPRKTISVYSNNYFKIDLTVLGFTPHGDLNPCQDFEGLRARVQYAESSDKSVDGQVIAVELRK
jgi:tetratricopeptide (TPR) repeat protein